jgi:tRNA threonylcarbamoyladenosine biosynthesis protein TsaB
MSLYPFHMLAIETAREACSVAVLRKDGFVTSATTLRPRSHAEQLVPMAVRAVEQAGLRFRDVEVVAVSAGPGSYTGLRIGVSTAKGFATAHGAHLTGVPTLEAYARAVAHSSRLYGRSPGQIAIALSARQSEIYFGLFEVTDRNGVLSLRDAVVVERSDAAKGLLNLKRDSLLLVAGDAAKGLVQEIRNENVAEWHFIPTALSVGALGMARAESGHFDDVQTFEPHYLKDYVAESGKSVFDRLTL